MRHKADPTVLCRIAAEMGIGGNKYEKDLSNDHRRTA